MALRARTGTVDLESRPRGNKKQFQFLQRWTMATTRRTISNSSSHFSSRCNINNSLGSLAVAPTPQSKLSSSVYRSPMNRHNHPTVQSHENSTNNSQHSHCHMVYSSPTTDNMLEWMQTECPREILPRILAFAGPQVSCDLSKSNRFWNNVMNDEATWRVLCEELYKWKQGKDEVPTSWKDYYKYNPCVPVDYSTVHAALGMVDVARNDVVAQPTAVRLLLRPGKYILREAITVDNPAETPNDGAAGRAATAAVPRVNNRAITVELATMEHFPEQFYPTVLEAARSASCFPTEPEPSRKRKAFIRNMLRCRIVDVEDGTNHEDAMDIDAGAGFVGGIPPDMLLENYNQFGALPQSPSFGSSASTSNTTINRASLILRTRRHNEPLVRVRQGTCIVRNIDLKHVCHGTDIWNGNSAVQLQPAMGPDEQPLMVLPVPTAILDRVDITSASGRGIVNIDGGLVNITSCYIHDCAATGIYVGGPGSRAIIERSDVVRNGNGNTQHRRGIARGHSGIYLEQGHASIIDCNVSQNSLTGISAVSPDNAVLNLQGSDLVSNGTFQLEMPAAGTNAHRNSTTANNNLATMGLARSRSGLVLED